MVDAYARAGTRCVQTAVQPVVVRQPVRSWRSIAAVRRIIRRERIDIVFTSQLLMTSLMTIARIGTNTSTAVHLGLHTGTSRTLTMGFRRVGLAVAPSQHVADLWLQSVLGPDQVRVVPNGVDLTTFAPLPSAGRQAVRKRLGVEAGPTPIIAYVGRIIPAKGVGTLLRAFGRYRAAGNPAKLLFVGPAEAGEVARLRQIASEEGIASHDWQIRPPTAAPQDIYHSADLVVAPSEWDEPFGLVPLEAIACGTPALVSDRGVLPEIVAPCRDALVFRSGDVSDLHGRLTSWFEDSGRRATAAEALLQHARRHFSFESCGDRYLEAFATLTRRS